MASLHITPGNAKQSEVMDLEKHNDSGAEAIHDEEAPKVYAQRGHAATDRYGRVLVHFDPAVEARIRRKIDWAICPVVAPLYLFCFIDVGICVQRGMCGVVTLGMHSQRNNIGNARIAGLERDLGLRGFQFNEILTIFCENDGTDTSSGRTDLVSIGRSCFVHSFRSPLQHGLQVLWTRQVASLLHPHVWRKQREEMYYGAPKINT